MQVRAGVRRTVLPVVAGAVAGLVVGFALGVAVGWPTTDAGSDDDADALALMCRALDDLDAAYLQSMADNEIASDEPEDHRMAASLRAAAGYAEAAAQAGEGGEELFATASDLRTAMQRIQGGVAREQVAALRGYC